MLLLSIFATHWAMNLSFFCKSPYGTLIWHIVRRHSSVDSADKTFAVYFRKYSESILYYCTLECLLKKKWNDNSLKSIELNLSKSCIN